MIEVGGVSGSGSLQPERIVPSTEALDFLSGTKRKIGIIRLWPGHAAAEHESIERYRYACSLINVDLVEVDRLGFMLHGERRQVTSDDVDFVISLHFETPKAYDCFSWGALWNPVDFYVDWGFGTFADHQFSHDGYFSCASRTIERFARQEMGERYHEVAHASVNHTLSGPVYRARERNDRRLVYCGINWERLSNKPGRFDHLLRPLDEAGVLDIFGPEVIQNTRVWEGFAGYKYEVPFDGQSLICEIASSGAVLALSSNAHLRSGVMTSRLFEGAAAGALVLADANSFVDRFFADVTVPIDVTGDASKDGAKIIAALNHYNNSPAEAYALASALQDRYIDSYMLHKQLLGVYREFLAKQKDRASVIQSSRSELGHVVLWLDRDQAFPAKAINSIQRQSGSRHVIRVITTGRGQNENVRLPQVDESIDLQVIYVDDAYDKPNAVGSMIMDAVEGMPAGVEYVSILTAGCDLFRDYAIEMTAAARDNPVGAICSLISRHYDPAEFAMSGTEYAEYWRPTANVQTFPQGLPHVLLRREFLNAHGGAIQMLGYDALVAYIARFVQDFAHVDSPLARFDLKVYERSGRLLANPYPNGGAFVDRYKAERKGIEQLSGSPADRQNSVDVDSFIARLKSSPSVSVGLLARVTHKVTLRRARKAARSQDWSLAERCYATIISTGGSSARIWKQYGHTLKEQGHIAAARYSYRIATDLDPDDADATFHLNWVQNKE